MALGAASGVLAHKIEAKTAIGVAVEDRQFVVAVLGEAFDFFAFDGKRALVLVDAVAVEHAHFNDRPGNTGRQAKRGVANVGSLFAEDGAQELFFRRHRAFALGRDLADENIARLHFGTNVNDARFVEVLERFFTHIRNVAGDFFRAELGVARHHVEFIDVDGGEHVIANDALRQKDRIFEVVAIPRHERDKHVAAKSQITKIGRGTIGDDFASTHLVTNTHQRTLVDAGVLVGTLELGERVDVNARLRRIGFFRRTNNDALGVHLIDYTGTAGGESSTGVTRHHGFHAGAHEGRCGLNQRHGLTLHVRAHEGAVGVVVFKEGDESGCDRNKLLGRHVGSVNLITRHQKNVTTMTHDDEFIGETAILGQLHIRLCDVMLGFLDGRQIDHVIRDLAVHDLAVGRFDEAILVHAGVGRQRIDQTDVRAFGRFNRADAAIMGGMHVADFEAGALTRQTARAKGRKAALMGDFGERVGLVHELRQLRGAEEFTHRSGGGLGVDQIMRHHRVDIDR